ncbi:MAG: hypothetical protein QGF90_01010 [Gammaproteobacteria bacterium]|jgi:DNA-directed RNA polymerase specialized sigma24 family protein|nr:hypothetical protein [Gammaproteobacteria bacterium]|tara:strand:+ start:164 stop:463 length:300 start_codon:yes stop_codon:yes gene_type:complete
MLDLKQKAYSEWLVVRSQQGERGAFDLLIEHWQKRYYLYAFKRLNDWEAAQDVTQEYLLSISRSLRKLADPELPFQSGAFASWSGAVSIGNAGRFVPEK